MKSDAQKRATAKWEMQNMARLQCKIKKEVAERFKMLCQQRNTTPNAVLKSAVEDYIKKNSNEKN